MQDVLGIVIRVSVMYLYALLLLRLAGKRGIDSLTPLDFLVSLVIGDMFDDVIWAEIPLAQGLVGFTTIITLHTLVAYASWRSKRVDELVTSTPTVLIREGGFVQAGLDAERTRRETVLMELRLQGEDKPEELQQACLETGGQLSYLKREPAQPAEKRDLPALRKAAA
jgi:uncharacterized membrane protein YcaP (DUF421 family)